MKRPLAGPLVLLALVLACLAPAARPAFAAPVDPGVQLVAPPPSSAQADSLAMLEKAVAHDSTRFDKLLALGEMYVQRERMQEALVVFSRAHRLQPKHVRTLVQMGVAADALGRADEAQTWYAQALAIAPGDTLASCQMASSQYAQGKYDEAMKLLRSTLAKHPNSPCIYFRYGVAFADAGIYRDAIRMWRKVIELAPGSPEAESAREVTDVLEKYLAGQ